MYHLVFSINQIIFFKPSLSPWPSRSLNRKDKLGSWQEGVERRCPLGKNCLAVPISHCYAITAEKNELYNFTIISISSNRSGTGQGGGGLWRYNWGVHGLIRPGRQPHGPGEDTVPCSHWRESCEIWRAWPSSGTPGVSPLRYWIRTRRDQEGNFPRYSILSRGCRAWDMSRHHRASHLLPGVELRGQVSCWRI